MQREVGNQANFPSFPTKLPLPVVDPDASPTLSVAINCSWLPYIRGALGQLVQQWTWPQDDPAALLLVQQRAMTLISMFEECDEALPFICQADFSVQAQPFALWSIDACGTYVPHSGYENSVCGPYGAYTYNGINLIVDLDNPVHLTGLVMVYDFFKGNYHGTTIPDPIVVDLKDDTHNTVLTSVYLSAVSDGNDQLMTWAGSITGVSQLSFNLECDGYDSGSPSGNCRVKRIAMYGYGNPGC